MLLAGYQGAANPIIHRIRHTTFDQNLAGMDNPYYYFLFRKAGTYLRWPHLLLFLIVFGAGAAFGQTDPTNYIRTDLIGASPNVSSLGRQAEVPLTYYTGLPRISIPAVELVDCQTEVL